MAITDGHSTPLFPYGKEFSNTTTPGAFPFLFAPVGLRLKTAAHCMGGTVRKTWIRPHRACRLHEVQATRRKSALMPPPPPARKKNTQIG